MIEKGVQKMITIITYNLKSREKDYTQFYTSIKNISRRWWRFADSVWMIETNEQPASIKNVLLPHIHSNDELFIARLDKSCSGYLPAEATDWLENNLENAGQKDLH